MRIIINKIVQCRNISFNNTIKGSSQLFTNISRNIHSSYLKKCSAKENEDCNLIRRDNSPKLVEKLFQGLIKGSRASLAESITLIETSNLKKKAQAKKLLSRVLLYQKEQNNQKQDAVLNSFRIGLSGPPGAGKSTFIEGFGKFLTNQNFKVAVLAIDPSSATSGGSILGDRTRMPELSKDIKAYIRPSPTRGHLGGVTRSTNEAIVLCEAAGYNVIIVETVGVGQSEYSVSDMVDMFALIIPPGSGDELQGIKKGIMELSDVVIVNKADGDFIPAARRVQYEYISALKFIKKRNSIWKSKVICVSSLYGKGTKELWKIMMDYKSLMESHGLFDLKRQEQQVSWMSTHLQNNIMTTFLENSSIKAKIKYFEKKVLKGEISPGDAADSVFQDINTKFN